MTKTRFIIRSIITALFIRFAKWFFDARETKSGKFFIDFRAKNRSQKYFRIIRDGKNEKR